MAGIYLHIPFCKSKCHYCNFFSLASKKTDGFVAALQKEIARQSGFLKGETANTVYFGGGTPSLLPAVTIKEILHALKRHHPLSENAEITLEANPDDLSPGSLEAFHDAGINRLSIGVQSFHDEDLKFLNRSHSSGQAVQCLQQAKEAGFSNRSLDLIYGIPGLSDKKWEENLTIALGLGVEHISAYALTLEPGTAMDVFVRRGGMERPSDDLASVQFGMLCRRLAAEGYIHYEISNFARNGFFSLHNTNYWNGEHYLGLGPSAHSFNGSIRRWNVSNLTRYIEAMNRDEGCHEEEVLTLEDGYNERVMTSLRTIWGCNTDRIRSEFGPAFYQHLMKEAGKHLVAGTLLLSENTLYLSEKGKFLADGIIADLFYTP